MNATPLPSPPLCEHGEGPVWDTARNRLLWVDLTGSKLHAYDPATGMAGSLAFPDMVCALGPRPDGRLVVAFAKHIAHVDPTSGRILEGLCEVEPDLPDNRCNDGKLDPAGRFWIGTMSKGGATPGAGSLYRLDDGGHLTRVLGDLTIANGMGWTADGCTMFFIDSPAREVWAFDFDPATAAIANRRAAVRVPDDLGVPDGMCVAADDSIWVAHWGAGCVCHWDPRDGRLIDKVATGCPHTTSCCFAPDGSLFITTSRLGLDDAALAAASRSGGLFVHRTQP